MRTVAIGELGSSFTQPEQQSLSMARFIVFALCLLVALLGVQRTRNYIGVPKSFVSMRKNASAKDGSGECGAEAVETEAVWLVC